VSVSEQVSLTEYGVLTTAVPQQNTSGRDLNPGGLKARIVVLEPATYGHCSLCKRPAVLPFCLEYLDSEADVIMWGPVCMECAQGHVEQSTGTF